MDENYIVYIRTDTESRVIEVNSSAFLNNTTEWIQIDEGVGDKYHHAQGNYLEKGLMDENGMFNYKYVYGAVDEIHESEKAEVVFKQKRVQEIRQRLLEIDTESIRPLRATADGSATEFDTQKLATLEQEATALRTELASLYK